MKITNEDTMLLMDRYPDKHFELAIVRTLLKALMQILRNNTNKKQSKKSASKSNKYGERVWDSAIPTDDYFKELKRVSKKQIVWDANFV